MILLKSRKPVPRYKGGGLFAALSNPNGAFNTTPLFTSPGFTPIQAPMVPMAALTPIDKPKGKMPSTAELFKGMEGKMFTGDRYDLEQRLAAKFAPVRQGISDHGEEWLLTGAGQSAVAAASKLDEVLANKAMNAYTNSLESKNNSKDVWNDFYVGEHNQMAFLNEKGKLVYDDYFNFAKNVKEKKWQPLRGSDIWDLRETQGWVGNDYSAVPDMRGHMSWTNAEKDIQAKFSNLGATKVGNPLHATLLEIGNLVGISQGHEMTKQNEKQLQALVDSLQGYGMNQTHFQAFVRNHLQAGGDPVDAYKKFGAYLAQLSDSKREFEYDKTMSSSVSDAGTDLKNQPLFAVQTSYNNLIGALDGRMPLETHEFTVGNATFVVPGVSIPVTADRLNRQDPDKPGQLPVYKNSLTRTTWLQKFGIVSETQLADGTKVSAQDRNHAFLNDLEPPRVLMLPVFKGTTNMATQGLGPQKAREAAALQERYVQALQKNPAQQPQLTQKLQADLRALTGRQIEMHPFTQNTVTMAVPRPGDKEKLNANYKVLKENDPNHMILKNTLDLKAQYQGATYKAALLNYGGRGVEIVNTAMYTPVSPKGEAAAREADQAWGYNANYVNPGAATYDAVTKQEQGGTLLPNRTAGTERPAFTFTPISLQDLD